MARILFFIFLAFLVWLAVRLLGAGRQRRDGKPDDESPAVKAPSTNPVEAVAQCAWCGVHVPTGTALALPDGRIYCGPAHRDAALEASSTGIVDR
jgi:hypothetical protein